MEKKGCQGLLILVGVLMAAGMILTGQFSNQQGQTPETTIVFEVGSQKVTLDQFNERVKTVAQNLETQAMSQGQMYSPGTPGAELNSHMTAIQGFVNDSAVASIAKEQGVTITESNIRSVGENIANQYMAETRARLMQQGEIKPEASLEEANKKIEELAGKSPAALITEQTDEIVKKFGDPKTKGDITKALLPTLLQESFKKSAQYSEEDLKADYNDYSFSVIKYDDLSRPLDDRQAAAIDAIEKIKAGTDFATIQTSVNPKAKPEDKTITLSGGALSSIPDLKPLMALKPGDLSDMILAGGTPTVYKLNSVKPNLPKDFDKIKGQLIENGKANRANLLYEEAITKKTEALTPKFEDKGLDLSYQVFYNAGKPEYQNDPAKMKEFFKEKLAEFRSPEFSSTFFQNIAAATQFLIQQSLYSQATDEEKTEMIDDYIEASNQMLEYFEDNTFRVTFAKELLEKGRNDDALTFATAAAQSNGDFDRMGPVINAQITMLITEAETKKAWSQESIDALKKELARWQTEQAQYEKDKKEIEDSQKKAQEELDKELADQKKEEAAGTSGTAPKPGETTPPVGGATIPKTGN